MHQGCVSANRRKLVEKRGWCRSEKIVLSPTIFTDGELGLLEAEKTNRNESNSSQLLSSTEHFLSSSHGSEYLNHVSVDNQSLNKSAWLSDTFSKSAYLVSFVNWRVTNRPHRYRGPKFLFWGRTLKNILTYSYSPFHYILSLTYSLIPYSIMTSS